MINFKSKLTTAFFGVIVTSSAFSQYYNRSEIRDDCATPVTADLIEICRKYDKLLAGFNSGDAKGYESANHYPHVRIAGGKVKIWNSSEEYLADTNDETLKTLASAEDYKGWAKTEWEWRKVVQSASDKIHMVATFSRVDNDGNVIATIESLHVWDKVDGGWGLRARSSYAGISLGAAF